MRRIPVERSVNATLAIRGARLNAVAKCIMDNVPATQSVGRWLGD